MNNDYLREDKRNDEEQDMSSQNLDNYEDMINDIVGDESEEMTYRQSTYEEKPQEEAKPINFEIDGTRYEAVLEKYDSSKNNYGKHVANSMKTDQSKGFKNSWSKINFNLNQGSRGYAVISSLTTIVAIAGIIIFYIVTKI